MEQPPFFVPYRIFSCFFKNMVKIANNKIAAVSFFVQYPQKIIQEICILKFARLFLGDTNQKG